MGVSVRRDGGAHTNFTTAGSTAGKGFVMVGWFPTVTAKICGDTIIQTFQSYQSTFLVDSLEQCCPKGGLVPTGSWDIIMSLNIKNK